MATLVPVNMGNAITESLEDLADRRGSIDGYVADRLGYEAKDLEKNFGAEQIDAIALAIDNIERGAGFIIGPGIGGMIAGLGTRAPFLAASALALVTLVYGLLRFEETLPPERRRPFSLTG